MGYLKYKGYTGSVEYSEEDKCLFGKVQGMSKDSITYEGSTVEELTADFEGAVDDYLALCKENGIEPRKPYTGVLNVRLTPEIHSGVAIAAQNAGITINAFIKNAVAKALGIVLQTIVYTYLNHLTEILEHGLRGCNGQSLESIESLDKMYSYPWDSVNPWSYYIHSGRNGRMNGNTEIISRINT